MECPGCCKTFSKTWFLERHLKEAPKARRADGAWLAENYKPCQDQLKRALYGKVCERSTLVQAIATSSSHREVFSGCGTVDVERFGLKGAHMSAGLTWAKAQGFVQTYAVQTGANLENVSKFVALVAHSVVACIERDVSPTCASACIGIGSLCAK